MTDLGEEIDVEVYLQPDMNEGMQRRGLVDVEEEEEMRGGSMDDLLPPPPSSLRTGGRWEAKKQLGWAVASLGFPLLFSLDNVSSLFLSPSIVDSEVMVCTNLTLSLLLLTLQVALGAVFAGVGTAHAMSSLAGRAGLAIGADELLMRGEARLGPASAQMNNSGMRTFFQTLENARSRMNGFGTPEEREGKACAMAEAALRLVGTLAAAALLSLIPSGVLLLAIVNWNVDFGAANLLLYGMPFAVFPFIFFPLWLCRGRASLGLCLAFVLIPLLIFLFLDVLLATDDILFSLALVIGAIGVAAAAFLLRNRLAAWTQQGNAALMGRGRVAGLILLALLPAGVFFDKDSANDVPARQQLLAAAYAGMAHLSFYLVALVICAKPILLVCLLSEELIAVAFMTTLAVGGLALANAILHALPDATTAPPSDRDTSA